MAEDEDLSLKEFTEDADNSENAEPQPPANIGQAMVDIIDLHNNNSQGIPAPPYGIGTPVTVSGIVTSGVGTFTTEYTDVYVQDATAGIMIYQYGAPPYEFAIGDSVTINVTIAQYRGMT